MTSLILCLIVLGTEPEASLLKPGAVIQKLWGEGSFTEGGAWTGDALLFSDIGNRIMKFDPKTNKVTAWRDPSGRANGMIYDSRGRLIVAEGANTGGSRRVSRTDPDGKIHSVVDQFEGKKFNSPNDVAVDKLGRIYVSDPRYVGTEPRELDFEAVFRIDTDGSVHRLKTSAQKPNGLVISPDGKTIYIADNGASRRVLLAVELDGKGDAVSERLFHDFGKGRGIDGMTITVDGRVVATSAKDGNPGIVVFSPNGKIIGFIPTPETPANCEFGGSDRSTLYISAGTGLYRIETTMKGFALWPN